MNDISILDSIELPLRFEIEPMPGWSGEYKLTGFSQRWARYKLVGYTNARLPLHAYLDLLMGPDGYQVTFDRKACPVTSFAAVDVAGIVGDDSETEALPFGQDDDEELDEGASEAIGKALG
jgi:hypothetical protein